MAYTLKDGSTVEDRKLGRLKHFDVRSLNYPIKKAIGEKPLRSYTWRVPKILDQGAEGSCTGMAVTHELLARPAMVKDLDETFAKEKIYWEAQRNDPWPGGAYPGANPFMEGSSVLAAVKAAQALGYYESYYWGFTFEEALLGIGYGGGGIVGINWYSGMYSPDSEGFIRPTGRIVGGHAFYVNKLSLKGDYVGSPNSWGYGYGQGGFMKIRLEDFKRLLEEDGEICFPVGRKREIK